VLVVSPIRIRHGEGSSHQKAKQRLYNLINAVGPKMLVQEYQYPNPFCPEFPWVFDIFVELWDGRKFAIEVDGKIGHTSKRSHEKREAKKEYLKTQGIALFGFSTKWIIGKAMLPDSLFYEELNLFQ
jgi:hypothetical protein